MEVNKALDMLKFSKKESSRRVEKLILSAIANWQAKNEGVRLEDSNLYVKEVQVDGGRILRRTPDSTSGKSLQDQKEIKPYNPCAG